MTIRKREGALNSDLITQDIRVEHLISYCQMSDKEFQCVCDGMFRGFDKIKKKYVKNSVKNRAFNKNENIYQKLLNMNELTKEDRGKLRQYNANSQSNIDNLRNIVRDYNISDNSSYIEKCSFNKRKIGYIRLFVNGLFTYYEDGDGFSFQINEENMFILLEKFAQDFKSFEDLVDQEVKDRYSLSTINKSKSAFNNIVGYITTLNKNTIKQ